MWQRIRSFLFENKTAKQTVAKNTAWLSISNFGGRLLKAGVVIYGARVLGAASYGVFSYAVTLAGFFCLFIDPGINSVLIREGAKSTPEERHSLFSTTLVMKAAITVLIVAAIVFIGPFFSTLPGAKILLPLVALIVIFDGTRGFLSSMFDAEEKMEWDAAAFLAANLGILIFGFILLIRSATPYSFTSGYVIGSAIGCAAALWLSRKYFKNIVSGISVKRMGAILRTAWPFAVTSALGALLTSTDIIVISWMRTAVDVGVYSAAIRIVQLLYLVPGIISTTTLPIFSRLAKRDPTAFRLALERTVSLIFLISVPISLGGAILSSGIMRLVFGPVYVAGSIAFSILMLSLSFDYAGSVIGNAVFAYDHQKSLIICSVLGGVGNLVFDLLLIPRWGMNGSAVATLLAQILSNAYLWYTMNKLNRFHVFSRIRKILVAGVLMAAVTILLATAHMNVVLNVAISGAVYFTALFLFKESLIGEVKQILALGTAKA
ncbi:MAG: oligosaccharide flippase family protein [Minisyncoccia bacterium]|jgi:O-antigen/teichoic acid export membrane protein